MKFIDIKSFNTIVRQNDKSGYNTLPRSINSSLTGLAILGSLLGGAFISSCSHHEKATSETPSVEVATPVVEDSVVIYSSFPAILQSDSKADVVARANGQLLRKHFENGQYVNKGDVLFTLESTLYDAQMRDAAAGVSSAEGQLDYADKHLTALENAFRASAVSEMDVIQARSAKAQAEANVKQAKADLLTSRTKRDYCIVRAPISGKISSATLDVGSYVAGEGSPVTLATIFDERSISAHFNVADHEYVAISARGDGFRNPIYRDIPVVMESTVDNSTSDAPVFHGDVVYESPSVDASTGNIELKARIISPEGKLRDGMYAKVSLPIGITHNAILVRDASISTDQRGKYLYTVNDSDKVVYTPVEIGDLYQDSLRLIRSGLKPRDRYVTKAMISVRTGETVKPVMTGNKKTK